MLQSIAIYLLKTIIVSAVLLLYYWFALRNKRFHYYNRFYLLSAVILSIALPFLNLNLFTVFSESDKAITMFNVIYAEGGEAFSLVNKSSAFDWQQLLLLAVLAVTIILLIGLALRIVTIYKMKRKYPVTNMQEFDFVNTDLQQAPFSFLKNIFWRVDISMEERTGRLILQHELAHIKEKHTWDKLFMQIVVSVLWANPLYRLYQKELYLIHEFVADNKSVTDSDTAAFAEMLLHAHYGKFNFDPAQPFFYSPIKRRLLMLTTSKEPEFSYVRRIMALPLIALTVLLFAFRLQKEKVSDNITTLEPGTNFTLVLDAGHGGQDNGAVATDGTKEKDIALAISKKIKSLSSEYGVDVIMTRTEDLYMSPKDKAGFSNKQKADAFLSVHVNATDYNNIIKGKGAGMEVLVSNDNSNFESSKLFGSAILQKLSSNFETTENLIQPKTGVWVLKATTTPAILVECGYLTNNKDLSLLKDDAQVELMARKILEGVVAYANNNNNPVSPYEVKMQDDDALADTLDPNDKKTVTINGKKVIASEIPPNIIYVINGEIKPKAEINKLNPANIKSVDVLKGESAISLYGNKAKDGAVLITTKDYKPASIIAIKKSGTEPLYVVDANAVKIDNLQFTGDNISLNTLKGDQAIRAYGENGRNGVIELTSAKAHENNGGQIDHLEVALTAQQSPSFPGGDDAWKKYLSQNLDLTVLTKRKAPPGTYKIVVEFMVNKDGSISDVKALNDPGYETAAEAERVVKNSPKWTPAKQDGENMNAKMRQTIVFNI